MVKSVSLYLKNGKSDKVYQAQLERSGSSYSVNFAYGRRGSTLRTGTKTKSPIGLDAATAIYEKLIREKKSKGYTEETTGEIYVGNDSAGDFSGIQCQLLNPVDEETILAKMKKAGSITQRKYDGVRLLCEASSDKVSGVNRRGLYVGLPGSLHTVYEAAARNIATSFVVDGEGLGDSHALFDILELDGISLRDRPYSERYEILQEFVAQLDSDLVFVAETSFPKNAKEMFNHARTNQWEGVVVKDGSQPYESGRPSSGGSQLKFKFYKTASVVVSEHNSQRSVKIHVSDDSGHIVPVGNVTIPANADYPDVGSVIEVRYLYAMPSHSLYQPTYLMVRSDIPVSECLLDQLEYKADSEL